MQKFFYSTNVKTDFLKISIISILNEIDGFFSLFSFLLVKWTKWKMVKWTKWEKVTRNTQNKWNEQATGMQCTEYLYIPATRMISRAYLTTTNTLIKEQQQQQFLSNLFLRFFLYTVLILIYIKIYIYISNADENLAVKENIKQCIDYHWKKQHTTKDF